MFDQTYDVVVVGYGAAGTAAAVTASDAGASVVLVEKCPEQRHTPSTRMSGGMVMTVTDVDAGARYLDVCASGMVPFDVSHAWADRAACLPQWFEDAIGGLDMVASAGAEHPGFDGAEAIVAVQPGGVAERLAAAAGGGPRLFKGLAAAVNRREIPVRWDTAASRLLQDADGQVTGLTAICNGQTVALGAHFGAVAVGLYDWSDDNSAEIERGWIAPGSTIAEAAVAAGMTEDAAKQAEVTVADYNLSCRKGEPDLWGRPADTMVPISEPPYYCVALWPGGSNTTGGPRRDRHSRILDAFGDPIPDLYGAGELVVCRGFSAVDCDGSGVPRKAHRRSHTSSVRQGGATPRGASMPSRTRANKPTTHH